MSAPETASAPAGPPPRPGDQPPAAGTQPPAAPSYSLPATAAYIGAALLISLTQGLSQGFVTTNISQIAGDLGVTTTQASWLTVAYMVPRVAMPLVLVKIRMQYGLRRFAEVAIVIYLAVALVAFWASDLRSSVMVQVLAGMSAAPLSTLAFMYMLEPLPPQWKLRLGMPLVLAAISAGPSLARVISPALLAGSGMLGAHVMALGMAALALGLIYYLPLTSPPRVRAIKALDFVSVLLFAIGFTGLIAAFTQGATFWWTNTPWLGVALVVAIAALTMAVILELHRKEPLLDIRWLASPPIVHLTITLLLVRLILSEQSSGAPRMFQALGIIQDQLVPLFSVLSIAPFVAVLALVPFLKPGNVPRLHVVALILIAAGAYMDSQATIDTRPAQMMLSQAMIAFAGTFYLAPAMMRGMLSVLARGPNYILSFIIIFVSTQSVGGVLGSGLFMTFINHREAAHLQILREHLITADPMVQKQIALRAVGLTSHIADGAMRQMQAVAQLAQEATIQAYVLAYNDAYRLIALMAAAALAALLLHMLRDRLVVCWPNPVHSNQTEPNR